jgi:hypothetical protein
MAAVLSISPTNPSTDQVALVTLTGAGDLQTRILLDSVVVASMCRLTGGGGTASITMGTVAGTQTIDAEQMIGGVWTNVATLPVDVGASATGTFADSTADAFHTMMKRTDLDKILLPAGTYSDWQLNVKDVSRGFRPLTVNPVPGDTVIWDGLGLGSGVAGPIAFGSTYGPGMPSFANDYITFDATGGVFRIQHYALGAFGLIYLGWVAHVAFHGFDVVNCSGTAPLSQCLYIASDGLHHSQDIAADDWTIAGDVGRTLNGVQTYHNPNVVGVGLDNWTVDRLDRWAFLDGDATGIALTNWNGTNCNHTISSTYSTSTGDTAAGTVSGCDGHGSCGALAHGSDEWDSASLVLDGGGNTP